VNCKNEPRTLDVCSTQEFCQQAIAKCVMRENEITIPPTNIIDPQPVIINPTITEPTIFDNYQNIIYLFIGLSIIGGILLLAIPNKRRRKKR